MKRLGWYGERLVRQQGQPCSARHCAEGRILEAALPHCRATDTPYTTDLVLQLAGAIGNILLQLVFLLAINLPHQPFFLELM